MSKNEKSKSDFAALDAEIEKMNKMHGVGSIIGGNEIIPVSKTSSGSLALDIALGGGWAVGKFIELIGPESSGKTTTSIHALIEQQKAFPDKKVAIVDAEHALDIEYAKAIGLNSDMLLISQPDSGEQALDIIIALASSNQISAILVDSIAALTPKAEIEGDMEDNQMGLQARMISKGCRKIASIADKNKVTVFWTNQLRMKIGVMFGNPETTPGGVAMKFYAGQRLDLRKKEGTKDKNTNEVLNIEVSVKVIKNKYAPPFRKCTLHIGFGSGFDNTASVIDYAVTLGIIKASGSWFSYGETRLGQGRESVKALLQDNPELLEELESKIKAHIV